MDRYRNFAVSITTTPDGQYVAKGWQKDTVMDVEGLLSGAEKLTDLFVPVEYKLETPPMPTREDALIELRAVIDGWIAARVSAQRN